LAINLGWAFGGAIGGIIASYNYSLLFWVDGITNLSAATLLYFVLAPSRNIATEVKTKANEIEKINSAYKDKTYLIFIVLVFLFAMCFFQLFTTVPVFYREKFHLPVFFIGLIMAMNGLIIAFFEMVMIFKLEGRRPHLYFISVGVVLIACSYFILNLTLINFSILAVLSMLFLTFGEILSMPFMNSYWIARTQNHNRGQYAALYSVAWSSAQAVGPLTGALIAEHYGYNTLWYTLAIICVLLSLIYQRIK
jgi:predicted MFS family arabinose efflux permease